MFAKHVDKIRPGATPERVLALCRAIGKKRVSKEDIISCLYLDKGAPAPAEEFADSLKIAEQELGMIKNKDGAYELVVPDKVISSEAAFRRWVAKKVFRDPTSTFFIFTNWFIKKDNDVSDMGNWEDKAVIANRDGIDGVDHNSLLGWRFWATFLGIGYICDTTLIPNMYTRLRDVLADEFTEKFAVNERVEAADFVSWLRVKIPEAENGTDIMSLALSNALRTLRDKGEIELISEPDALKKRLYFIEEDRHNEFSHIVVKEGIK